MGESKLLAKWCVCDRCGYREGALLSADQRECVHVWRTVSWFSGFWTTAENDETPAG